MAQPRTLTYSAASSSSSPPSSSSPSESANTSNHPRMASGSSSYTPMAPAVTSPSASSDPLSAYSVVSAVGRGKFSTVYKAQRKSDGRVVALKRIRMGATATSTAVREKCLKEVRLLQSLDHSNIIRYLDSFAVHPNTLVIVLEWATDGDLQCHLRRIRDRGGGLPEPVIWQSFVQICEALAHMHERRILHRDLKPANIFLHRDGTIKVGDLGLGRTLSDDTPEAFSKVGTPLYMSPEALRGDGYDMKSDIWSLGCVLYELAMLRSPFKEEGLKMFQLFEKIVRCDYKQLPAVGENVSTSSDADAKEETSDTSKTSRGFSEDLRYLTSCMICREPGHRPDIWQTLRYAAAQLERLREANGGAAVVAAAAAAQAAARQHSHPAAKHKALAQGAYVEGHDDYQEDNAAQCHYDALGRVEPQKRGHYFGGKIVDENSSIGSNMGMAEANTINPTNGTSRSGEEDKNSNSSDTEQEYTYDQYSGESCEDYEDYAEEYDDTDGNDNDDDDDDIIALDVVQAARQLQNKVKATTEILKKASLSRQGRDVFSQSLSAEDMELESVRSSEGFHDTSAVAAHRFGKKIDPSSKLARASTTQSPIVVKDNQSAPSNHTLTSGSFNSKSKSAASTSPPPIVPIVKGVGTNSVEGLLQGRAKPPTQQQPKLQPALHDSSLASIGPGTQIEAKESSLQKSKRKMSSSKLPKTTGASSASDACNAVLRPLNPALQQTTTKHRERGLQVGQQRERISSSKHYRSRSVPELQPMKDKRDAVDIVSGSRITSGNKGEFSATIGTSTPITRKSSNRLSHLQRRGDLQGQYGKSSFTRRSATPILTPLDRTPSPFKSTKQPSLYGVEVLRMDSSGKLPRGSIQLSPRADLPVPRISPAQRPDLELPVSNYNEKKMIGGWTLQGTQLHIK